MDRQWTARAGEFNGGGDEATERATLGRRSDA